MRVDGAPARWHGDAVHTAGRWLALGFAVVVLVVAALLGYGITSEYGAAPNGGGIVEAIGAVIGLALPTTVVVLALTYAGTRGLSAARRRRVVVAAAAVTALACALAVLLGSVALDRRCEQRGPQHSAACPGFTGPG